MEHPKDFKEVESLMAELMRISACNEVGDKLVIELQAKIAALEAERDALRAAIATVAEGWTLPEGARKVLETALWGKSQS